MKFVHSHSKYYDVVINGNVQGEFATNKRTGGRLDMFYKPAWDYVTLVLGRKPNDQGIMYITYDDMDRLKAA